MKKQHNIKFKGFKPLKTLYDDISSKSYMVSLQNSAEFLAVWRRFGKMFTRVLFPNCRLSTRLHLLHLIGNMILNLHKHHGSQFVVKYLKCCSVALQRKLGNSPLKSLRELEPDLPFPRLTSSGLPSFIPLRDRRGIENLSLNVIQ
jgi:hypothetical protein